MPYFLPCHLAKPDQGGGVGGVLWTQSFECMLLAKMKEGILGPFVIFARHQTVRTWYSLLRNVKS